MKPDLINSNELTEKFRHEMNDAASRGRQAGAELASEMKEDKAKFAGQTNTAKQMAEANRPEHKSEAASASKGENQGSENDYYSGMSQ